MELYFQSREEWHDWLERNHETADEAWLVYYKKESGKARIPYVDAVEEALCYGWIDGKIKSINKDNSAKKTETRERRIAKIIDLSEKNKKPGMM